MLDGGHHDLAEATAILGNVLARVADSDWAAPTPCAGWSVRELLNHVVATLTKFSDFAEGLTDAPRTPPGDMLAPDAYSAYAAARTRALEAWAGTDPERRCRLPFGDFSAPQAAAIAAFDLLVHAWDLGQALGTGAEPPSQRLRAVAISVAECLVTEQAVADGFYAAPSPSSDVAGWGDLLGRTGRGERARE